MRCPISKKAFLPLIALLVISTVFATVGLNSAQNANYEFEVIVTSTEYPEATLVQFTLDYDKTMAELLSINFTPEISNQNIQGDTWFNYLEDTPYQDISGDIARIKFKSIGNEGDKFSLDLKNTIIVSGGSNPQINSLGDISLSPEPTLTECINYPNSHLYSAATDSGRIPNTNCACDFDYKTNLNSQTNDWECQLTTTGSPFGENSQASELGGYPIFNTGWSCKPGFLLNPDYTTLSFLMQSPRQACIEYQNQPPIANITVSDEKAEIGKEIHFSGESSIDPDGMIVSYSWDLGAIGATAVGGRVSHTYTNLSACPSAVCVVSLTVIDSAGNNGTKSISLLLVEPIAEEDKEEEEEFDPTGLEIKKGETYTDQELKFLGLTKGKRTLIGSEYVTVSSSGKVTRVEPRIRQTSDTTTETKAENKTTSRAVCFNNICEEGEMSKCPLDCTVGDSICQTDLGENPANAPTDCEESSGFGLIFGLIIVTLIGGGGFFAWKKGFISADNLKFGKKSTKSAFEFTEAPTNPQPKPPASTAGGMTSYIKQAREQGFSNEQIRTALKKKGWDDSALDGAFNASRE